MSIFSKINPINFLFNKTNNSNHHFVRGMPPIDNKTSDILKSSYMSQSQAEDNLAKHGFVRDPQLSSNQQKVFYNEKTNEPIVIHRGSKTVNDYLDDGLIAVGLGKLGHRYKNAVRVNEKIKNKYGHDATNLGHSLGGWIAENSGKNKIVTINKAVGAADVFKKLPKNQTDIRVKNDIIALPSYSQTGSKKILIDNKHKSNNPFTNAYNAHSVDNLY
jgi:hypothetical protein